MTAAVALSGLSKRFGAVRALDGVSIEVPEGSVFGLLGPNGAGKTTLLSIVAGFLRADAGEVHVLGCDVRDLGRARGRFGILPQDAELQPDVPLGVQLALFARLGGLADEAAPGAARSALERVGLDDAFGRTPRALSHGMRKRAALAQALLGDPEVLFLDEPTAGLDPENARRVRDLVRDLAGQRTLVLSSHNLHEIQDLCDRVAILHRGRVAESGSLEQLTRAAFQLRIALGSAPTEAARKLLEGLDAVVRVELREAGELHVHLAAAAPAERDAAVKQVLVCLLERDLVPRSLHQGASLEARFLEITGSDAAGSD